MGVTAINGVAITSSLANTSSTINITDTTTGTGPYYPVFVDSTSGGRLPRVDSSTFTYNATTNTLTAAIFAGTASAASRVDVTVASSNNTNYVLFTPQFNAGGTSPSAVSESGNINFNPSTQELTAGLINNQAGGTKAFTADTNLTIDASLTQSMTWIASLTLTRSLIINNLADGKQVYVYIRNTNAKSTNSTRRC